MGIAATGSNPEKIWEKLDESVRIPSLLIKISGLDCSSLWSLWVEGLVQYIRDRETKFIWGTQVLCIQVSKYLLSTCYEPGFRNAEVNMTDVVTILRFYSIINSSVIFLGFRC